MVIKIGNKTDFTCCRLVIRAAVKCHRSRLRCLFTFLEVFTKLVNIWSGYILTIFVQWPQTFGQSTPLLPFYKHTSDWIKAQTTILMCNVSECTGHGCIATVTVKHFTKYSTLTLFVQLFIRSTMLCNILYPSCLENGRGQIMLYLNLSPFQKCVTTSSVW